ncbi:fumarylacetoacetate hydrolase [Salibacterium salarium]|uniref:Fumarylacetoacetate hydrolase n=1 Tax=Salibacterium salarium TaxID=284579 RepID=A0A3R9PAE2_9BACI|nr:fumarylacetoacetate hydrolase family protein [Salibacterium salarium]RSL33971.1 fumarylacetoacetate hydrolase [Salibacterium salarium]
MRIIRIENSDSATQIAALTDKEEVFILPFESVIDLFEEASQKKVSTLDLVKELTKEQPPLAEPLENLKLLIPIEVSEVWASGVTYQKSREARNYEASDDKDTASTFYDKVYDAKRPEIFFKSTGQRVIGQNEEVYLRTDSSWQIPEPELGLVVSSEGSIMGYTVGNDMSCRDIEGENPLYLPQAKIWKNSCSVGPAIRLAETVDNPYDFQIICRITREGEQVFEGDAKVSQLKRKLEELVACLGKDNDVFNGTVLLTGTCIVPPNDFTLQDGDEIEIEIPGIGTLCNPVKHPAQESIPSS